MEVLNLQTFGVFLSKTLREKKYYWVRNFSFSLFPIVSITMFLYLSSNMVDQATTGNQMNIYGDSYYYTEEFLTSEIPHSLEDKIYFIPNTVFFSNLMESLRLRLEIVDENVQGFENEIEMWKNIGEVSSKSFIIKFDNDTSNLKYTIRTKNNLFNTDQQYSKNLNWILTKSRNEYITSGFVGFQYVLDTTYYIAKSGKTIDYELELKRLPQPNKTAMKSKILCFGLNVVVFASLISLWLIFSRLVEEKSCGFKEQLKNATRFSSHNNLSLFLTNVFQMLTIFLICFGVGLMDGIWLSVNVFYPICLTILFVLSLISYTFLISAFFESVSFSSVGAFFWYFVPFLAYEMATIPWKKILIILPLNAFYQGILILHDFTNSGHYFSSENFFQLKHPNDQTFSMFFVFVCLIFSTFLFSFLYFYVSHTCPGKHGIPQSPFFIFQRSYYVPNKIDAQSENLNLNFSGNGFENFSYLNDKAIVKIRSLTKTYKSFRRSNKTVVRNISMDIYKNQITVLLGANGAGKTTLMCILTGLIPKSSGKVIVDNLDNIIFYRSLIGFCPQHNISLPYMTCLEHVIFFGQLRGLALMKARKEAETILKKVNLWEKRDNIARTLSGGMLRKLCLANAVIGETMLLILDEPTSGLDPESRRDIWNILLKLKKENSILITTHHMEEADALGDKIAIMENGELNAYGSPMFLKQFFGNGYTLKMLKNQETNNFDRASVHNTIKRHIPMAEQKESVDQLYCMTLPYKDQNQFGTVLQELECNKYNYGIDSLSITNTTLEEVFLNSASIGKLRTCDDDETDAVNYIEIIQEINIHRYKIWFRQFTAIFYKKSIYWRRNWVFTLLMISIPVIMTWMCFLLSNYLSEIKQVSLNIKMSNIEKPLLFVNFKLFDDYHLEEIINRYAEAEGSRVLIKKNEDLEQNLLELAESKILDYYDNLIGAIEFESNEHKKLSIRCYFSQNILHSAPVMVNFVDNIMLQFNLNANHTIEVINNPLNREDFNINYIQNLYTEFVPIGLMMYMLLFLPFTFKEKISGFKQLQNIPASIHWCGIFLSDLLLHCFVCCIVIIITKMDIESIGFDVEELKSIALLFFIYGVNSLTIIYIVSQCFNNLNSAIMFLNYLQIISLFGIIAMSSTKESMKDYEGLITLFHVLPDFALKNSIKVIYEANKFEKNHLKIGNAKDSYIYLNNLQEYSSVFNLDQFYISNMVVFLLAVSFLLFFVENQALMDQMGYFCNQLQMCNCFKRKKNNVNNRLRLTEEEFQLEEDSDVKQEKAFVQELISKSTIDSKAMIVSNLEKIYNGNFKAVDELNFTVNRGECFGLLGCNGAGKTSTFEMMTTSRTKTSGDIYINGVSCDTDPFLYRHQFGYCPQQDALCDYMTSAESLKYMLMIRGSPITALNNEVEKWLKKIDLEDYRNVETRTYSGGTKRKLNTAMAMIGDPFIVFLDEPTTGVDPRSRRYVWNCIRSLQKHHKTIVLTSHSMDECEMLCSRLSIMGKGKFMCGPAYVQKLKIKFGKGFSLMIKMKPIIIEKSNENIGMRNVEIDSIDSTVRELSGHEVDNTAAIKSKIKSLFTCELKDEHEGILQYFIYSESISWAEVFGALQKFSTDHESVIDNFTINETSLEDIFQQFQNSQSQEIGS